jgi:hypothetical protein
MSHCNLCARQGCFSPEFARIFVQWRKIIYHWRDERCGNCERCRLQIGIRSQTFTASAALLHGFFCEPGGINCAGKCSSSRFRQLQREHVCKPYRAAFRPPCRSMAGNAAPTWVSAPAICARALPRPRRSAFRLFLSMPRVTRHLVRPAGLGWPLTNAPWGF